MFTKGPPEISLYQMYVFLSAAKYENFARAAKELHTTQASVSRNIAAIESETKIKLFSRQKRRVILTPAGKTLSGEWTKILDDVEKSIDKSLQLQQFELKRLNVGDYNSTPNEEYLMPIMDKFESENPDVELSVGKADPISILNGLKDGTYDAIFFSACGIDEILEVGLSYVHVLEIPPSVVIARRHPLFNKTEIHAGDFKNQTIIAMGGKNALYLKYVKQVCAELAIPTDDIKFADNPHTLAMELMRGKCIAILDRCFAPAGKSDLRHIELTESTARSGFVLAFSPDNTNPYLKKLVKCCRFFNRND